jgi:hypothetical protein
MRAESTTVTQLDEIDAAIFGYRRQLRMARNWVKEELLPTFSKIERKAKSASQQHLDRLVEGKSEQDAEDLAKYHAIEIAPYRIERYQEDAQNFAQAFVNLLFVHLFHLFEQQLADSIAKKRSAPPSSYKSHLELCDATYEAFGFDVTLFSVWPKMDELRLIANTVKHVSAKDARKLAKRNPVVLKLTGNWLTDIEFDEYAPVGIAGAMMGRDLVLSPHDYDRHVGNVEKFWREFQFVKHGERSATTLKGWVIGKREAILALCEKHHATNVRIFGSVARNEAGPADDIELLVSIPSGGSGWLPATEGLRQDLVEEFDRKFTVVSDQVSNKTLLERAQKDAVLL